MAYCLQQLKDKPGFPSIKTEIVHDKNKNKDITKYFIAFEFNPVGTWLADPEPDPDKIGAVTQNKDITGVWGEELKKPAADRFLTPKIQSDKDTSFSSAPYAKCSNDRFDKFFKHQQLINHDGSKKHIKLDPLFFNSPKIEVNEYKLFSVVDRHLRKSLSTQASSHQVLQDLRKHLYFLTHNWDKFVDLEENPTDTTLEQNIPDGYFLQTLKNFRTALELLLACSQNTIDWTTASIAACRASGRKEVLNRCYGDPESRPIKADLLNSGFLSTTLFGRMPESDRHQLHWDTQKKARLKVIFKEKVEKASDAGAGPSGYASKGTKRKSVAQIPPAKHPAPQPFQGSRGHNQSNKGGSGHKGWQGNSGKNSFKSHKNKSKNKKRGN